jgi:hypothetical protein
MKLNRGPLARSEDLIIEELGDEVLIYDSKTDKGHCLSPDAARVWRRCDGRTPSDGLAAQVGLSEERVESALDELERCELLAVEEPTLPGHTRREMSVKVVKAGVAVAATPLIVSVLAPTPAMAATLNQCAQFSSNNCGGDSSDGCSMTPGCCCCTPVIMRPFPANEPCAQFAPATDSQCKSCVPCDKDKTYCPQFDHGDMSQCSAGDCAETPF